MSIWQRLRSRLRPRQAQATALSRAQVQAGAGDDPLQLLHRYSQQAGHLTQRPTQVEPAVLAALSSLIESGNKDAAFRIGLSLSRAVPTDLALLRLLVETLCRAQRFAESIALLEQALQLAPPSQSLRFLFLLAEAELAVGNLPSSRRRLAELLALDLHYPEARARLLALAESRPQRAWLADPQSLSGQVERAVLPTVAMVTSGRYQLLHELGAGRTGTVYRALDRELGCELALKVFHPHLRQRGDDDTLLRVLHEARLLSAARHPGIVALYAVEGDELGDGKQLPLLAMELCQGGSLRTRLCEGLLPVEVVLLRTLELLETLAELHAGSVSHGDLKPENLLFRGDGRCRYPLPVEEQRRGDLVIADFGLSRLGGGTFGAGIGTLGYLSRERFLGSPPAPAADVFAVGVILCEMLLGELPSGSADLPSRTEPVSGPAILQHARLSHLGSREPALRQLLSTLLTEEASVRPTAMGAVRQLRQLL